ncbi:hypothetical protein H6F67_26170 [Microcoleus sp. FACHB-1515]|uniref:DUF5895 domain-containing protein n=1 Tax=Cyanophyceae TaxID=3028117 RepID=UPI001683CB51|nr:DUF5895 domain-containing protein [Microcoleus sp. FACHB-1515]MBD2093335.1 hypothetical protein [Microcoleus sp. FACHB-1515]
MASSLPWVTPPIRAYRHGSTADLQGLCRMAISTPPNTRTATASRPRKPERSPVAPTEETEDLSPDEVERLRTWVDPEMLDARYDQMRRRPIPSGIVVNDDPAGILIPVDQLKACGWQPKVTKKQLHTYRPKKEPITGLLLMQVRMLILGHTELFVERKRRAEGKRTILGWASEIGDRFNKRTMSLCRSYLMVFLDENNQPLHTTPLKVTFKNVARVNLEIALEKYYGAAEAITAKLYPNAAESRTQGKSDTWRSHVVIELEFKPEYEGKQDQSLCCKVGQMTRITGRNYDQYLLGDSIGMAQVKVIRGTIADILGNLDALPAIAEAQSAKALPTAAANAADEAGDAIDVEAVDVEVEDDVDDFTADDEREDEDDFDLEDEDEDDLD